MLSVVLIDDHAVFRDALKALLATEPDLRVVGEASDARQGYEVVEHQHPDVVVLDISLPGVDGFSAARELRRRSGVRILMLSMFGGEAYVARAFAVGASGFALKSQSGAAVIEALHTVGRGQRYLPPQLDHAPITLPAGPGDPAVTELSEREREVFELVVRGFSNTEVAKELCISPKTVETHRMHIHKKLGVHSVAELVRFAALHGLLH
jgi:DNA-binding NarL/FixJ family response regulator